MLIMYSRRIRDGFKQCMTGAWEGFSSYITAFAVL